MAPSPTRLLSALHMRRGLRFLTKGAKIIGFIVLHFRMRNWYESKHSLRITSSAFAACLGMTLFWVVLTLAICSIFKIMSVIDKDKIRPRSFRVDVRAIKLLCKLLSTFEKIYWWNRCNSSSDGYPTKDIVCSFKLSIHRFLSFIGSRQRWLIMLNHSFRAFYFDPPHTPSIWHWSPKLPKICDSFDLVNLLRCHHQRDALKWKWSFVQTEKQPRHYI